MQVPPGWPARIGLGGSQRDPLFQYLIGIKCIESFWEADALPQNNLFFFFFSLKDVVSFAF